MRKKNLYRDRKFVTFRFFPEDRELLQHIGKGRPEIEDRYEAFLDLAKLVPGLELPNIKDLERRPIRLGIPAELEEIINKKSEETGQPFITILLEAAKVYRRLYPFTPPKKATRKPRRKSATPQSGEMGEPSHKLQNGGTEEPSP